jgi:hypothetical protein
MLRPEHLKKIDDFIDNLNFTKLLNRFKKEDGGVNEDTIKEYRKYNRQAK